MTILDLAKELISVPSHEGEEEVGKLIEKWLKEETDAEVLRDGMGNIIARRGSGEELAFIGHHDVVPPSFDQMEGRRCKVFEKGGRLYGRGSADMKGALASMMHSFRDANAEMELVFASFVGEEIGGVGAQYAISKGFNPKFVVVGEGSRGYSKEGVVDIAIAHRGRRESQMTILGEAAHASQPNEERNAIHLAGEIIQEILKMPTKEVKIEGENMKGSVTVTGIEGGTAANINPDKCTLIIDERTVPGESGSIQVDGAIEWEIKQEIPPFKCQDMSFAHQIREVANGVTKGSELIAKPHTTDAGWFSEKGCIGVVCGPAEMGQAHTSEESVDIRALEDCSEIYRRIAEVKI